MITEFAWLFSIILSEQFNAILGMFVRDFESFFVCLIPWFVEPVWHNHRMKMKAAPNKTALHALDNPKRSK